MSDQHLRLTEGLRAPAHARAWVAARLPTLPAALTDDALLLVSELVTNAVQHGAPDIEIGLVVTVDRLRIEVGDGGEGLPVLSGERPSVDRPTGRGLLIVAATAQDWGVVRTPDQPGKTVWAELLLVAPSGAPSAATHFS